MLIALICEVFHYLVMKSDYVKLKDFFVELLIKFLSLFLQGTKIYQASIPDEWTQ
jgi:hypothetical protein